MDKLKATLLRRGSENDLSRVEHAVCQLPTALPCLVCNTFRRENWQPVSLTCGAEL